MTTELDVFRAVNFNWSRQLKSIWRDPPYHVPNLHQQVIDGVVTDFISETAEVDPFDEPLGQVVVGPKGFGKTHLIGELRRQVWDRQGWFVLLDFIGIKHFWSSVALGFLNSLQVRTAGGKTQYDRIVEGLVDLLQIDEELRTVAKQWSGQRRDMMGELARVFTTSLDLKYRDDANQHRDVVTALVFLASEDLECRNSAHGWLQGMNFDGEDIRSLGFKEENSPIKVVKGLSWIMSRLAPTLIAVDQIDAIVTASNSFALAAKTGSLQEQAEAQSIVNALAEGLISLHDTKRRSVTVVSCLEATWKVLEDVGIAMADRYKPPLHLEALSGAEAARALVFARLAPAYGARGFAPSFETWPFAGSAFDSAEGLSPRGLLKACYRHQQNCIAAGEVTLCRSFDDALSPEEDDKAKSTGLGQVYQKELGAAQVPDLADTAGEDQFLELIDGTLRLLEHHYDLPDDIDSEVQRDPDQTRPALHGRLSFTFLSEGSREQHYCFRFLGHSNAIAFQTRLKAAMTASGIDTALKFRHLFILRHGAPPSGLKTAALVDQFKKAGGQFIAPTDDDLRIFVALAKMQARELPEFETWLRQEQPLFKSQLFREAGLCPPPFLVPPTSTTPDPPPASPPPPPPPPRTGRPADPHRSSGSPAETPPVASQATPPASSKRLVPIGHRYERGAVGGPVTLAADLLPRHVAVLAGPGSGKTVFMRRIVEEAALLGIPSIVLDPNNDLSRLDDAWPARPESWSDEDAANAQRYHACADVVIWTPGVNAGNPITLSLLPDFALIDDPDERNQAIEMARATLSPLLPGSGVKANRMKGVLADAIRRFAAGGGSQLKDLIALLADLPDGVSQDSNAQRLASEIADQLHAAIAVNPLLQSAGEPLDPRTMFEGPSGKTRISVINLAGLASEEARDSFVNRLQMSLFTFIKNNPSPTGRLYVIDEAQNFVPSGTGTACKASAQSLAAQARKYGLGMLFATQTPRGIDSKIVSNCTTHVYGRMGSPATIDAIHDLMAAKGGAADDIGKLSRGEFYFSTDGSTRPFKVRTPLCLSWHPANPPTAEEVVRKARATRLSSPAPPTAAQAG
jgi:Helicase HerA, central domain